MTSVGVMAEVSVRAKPISRVQLVRHVNASAENVQAPIPVRSCRLLQQVLPQPHHLSDGKGGRGGVHVAQHTDLTRQR